MNVFYHVEDWWELQQELDDMAGYQSLGGISCRSLEEAQLDFASGLLDDEGDEVSVVRFELALRCRNCYQNLKYLLRFHVAAKTNTPTGDWHIAPFLYDFVS